MKKIEITDQLRHRLALNLTDRQMADAENEYAIVKGRMQNAFADAKSALGCVAQLLFGLREALSAGCDYTVTVRADNSGYAKSCKYRKETVRADAVVHVESGRKAKVVAVSFVREKMRPGEMSADNVMTRGAGAREAYILRRLGVTRGNPCYLRNVKDASIARKGEDIMWTRFVDNCADLEVIG